MSSTNLIVRKHSNFTISYEISKFHFEHNLVLVYVQPFFITVKPFFVSVKPFIMSIQLFIMSVQLFIMSVQLLFLLVDLLLQRKVFLSYYLDIISQ